MKQAVFVLFLFIVARADAQNSAPDLIVYNAQVTTLDGSNPEASAVAVTDGLFTVVGTDEAVLGLARPATLTLDAAGRRLIPGLIDSHAHPTRAGRYYNAELRWDGVPTLAKALDMLREQAERTPPGQWVRVIGGWSPYQFAERRFPTPEELTEAAPNTPVFVLYLYSRGFLNEAGITALELTSESGAPAGSRYEVGSDGALTGVLLAEPNPDILYETIGALPSLSAEDQANSARQFYHELARFGLTGVIDAGGGGHSFSEDYVSTQDLAIAGEMPIRLSYYLFPQTPGEEFDDFTSWVDTYPVNQNEASNLPNGYVLEGGGEFLVWSAGDFENFTAPRPELDPEVASPELTRVATLLVRHGWPIRIHATYDESISRILDVFEAIDEAEREAGRPGFAGIRWAIDHGETISDENIARVKALGGGIAIQDRMAFAGEFFAERYGPNLAANAPPLRKLLDADIPLGAGTDASRVSTYNPWVSLHWLVTGETVGGSELASEENQLSRDEALRLFTQGSAWFSGEEELKGTVAPGQYADFALLSDDYFSVPEEQIKDIESVLTVVGGNIAYGAADYALFNPPLPAVSPAWSPVARFGGYYRE